MAGMPTTIQVSERTHQMLSRLKAEMGVRSLDEVIRRLILERERLPASMFGSNPRLRPFTPEDEADLHEL